MKSFFRRIGFILLGLLCWCAPEVRAATAPENINGWTFLMTITNSTPPWANSGVFLFAMTNATGVRIINLSDTADIVSGASYQGGNVGEVSLGTRFTYKFIFEDDAQENGWWLFVDNDATNSYQLGTFQAAGHTSIPTVLSNQVLSLSDVKNSAGITLAPYRLFFDSPTAYRIGSPSGQRGTYIYNLLSSSTGQLGFQDSIMGTGIMRIAFQGDGRGFFAYKIGDGNNYQIGRFIFEDVAPPEIVTEPEDQVVLIGRTAIFTVEVTGTSPLSYQWYKNGFPISNSTNIVGATTATLKILSASDADRGNYKVLVSNFKNPGGVISEIATLTVVCETRLSTSGAFFSYAGGTKTITASTPQSCSWIATSSHPWLKVLFPTGVFTGETNVIFSADPNTNDAPRTATLTIGSQVLTVAQGAPYPSILRPGVTVILTNATGANAIFDSGTNSIVLLTGTNGSAKLVWSTNFIEGAYVVDKTPSNEAILGFSDITIRLHFDSPRTGLYDATQNSDADTGGFAILQSAPDYSLDGQLDLEFQNLTNGLRQLWFMNGTNVIGTNIQADPLPVGRQVVGWADFDRNDLFDFLDQQSNNLFLTLNTNASDGVHGTSKSFKSVPAGWRVVATADFNGDSFADIVLQRTNGVVAIWKMNGTNVASAITLRIGKPPAPGWRVVGAADFNGDGETDILFQHDNGQLAAWYMSQTTVVTAGLVNQGKVVSPGWRVAALGDLNFDGQTDLILQSTKGSLAAWFMNRGTVIKASFMGTSGSKAWRLLGPH